MIYLVCAFLGGLLLTCGLVTAAAVLLDAHPEGARWVLSQAAAGTGAGLIAATRARRS